MFRALYCLRFSYQKLVAHTINVEFNRIDKVVVRIGLNMVTSLPAQPQPFIYFPLQLYYVIDGVSRACCSHQCTITDEWVLVSSPYDLVAMKQAEIDVA